MAPASPILSRSASPRGLSPAPARETPPQKLLRAPSIWGPAIAALAVFVLVSTAFATGTVRPAPPPAPTPRPGEPRPTPDTRPSLSIGGFVLQPPVSPRRSPVAPAPARQAEDPTASRAQPGDLRQPLTERTRSDRREPTVYQSARHRLRSACAAARPRAPLPGPLRRAPAPNRVVPVPSPGQRSSTVRWTTCRLPPGPLRSAAPPRRKPLETALRVDPGASVADRSGSPGSGSRNSDPRTRPAHVTRASRDVVDGPGVGSSAILAAAVLVAVFARPAVSTFEIQRRDRLPPSARFVTFAYEFLLNRAPDATGLATYQRMFDEQGPEAVAAALAQSQEFRDKTATSPAGGSQDRTAAADSIPSRVVSAYEAGITEQLSSSDSLGRIGFVCLIGVCLLAIGWLRNATRQASSAEDDSRIYLPARYIVGLFAALASMAWVTNDLLLGAFGAARFTYIEWLSQVTTVAGSRGLTNVWTPYPQGAQDLIVGLAAVANVVAASLASDVWTSFSVFRILFQFVFLLLPSVLTVAVVASLGRRISSATATLAALGAAFSIAPMYYGFLSANVTDPLPVLLALVAVWCLARERHALAGFAIGAGAALKLFPLLLLPVALVFVDSWKARLRMLIATVVVVLAVFLPPALANVDIFLSPIRWQSGRPAWESLYAFTNWVIAAPHEFRAPYFVDISVGDGFGWVFWGITPRISALVAAVPAGPLRWENLVSFAGAVLIVLVCFTARNRSMLSLVRWCLFSLAGFLFWSTGWSPQYELYVVPFVLLAVRPAGVGLVAALLLEGLTLLEYPVLLPWAYFYGGSVVWIMWAALVGRYILLAWLCVYVVQTEAGLDALSRVGRDRCSRGRTRATARRLFRPSRCCCLPSLQARPPRLERVTAWAQDRHSNQPTPPRLTWIGHFLRATSSLRRVMHRPGPDSRWSTTTRPGSGPSFNVSAAGRSSAIPRRVASPGTALLSQATQRAVLQWSAVTGQVESANVLDLMHEQGLDDDLLRRYQIPPPTDVDEAGLPYETIAARRLEWLDARPAIKKKYCEAPGGADPLVLWGLPTSTAINVSSVGTVYVVRTQRAAFQEWVDGAPWAAPGEVTVVLAGDLAKDFALLPPDSVVPGRPRPLRHTSPSRLPPQNSPVSRK